MLYNQHYFRLPLSFHSFSLHRLSLSPNGGLDLADLFIMATTGTLGAGILLATALIIIVKTVSLLFNKKQPPVPPGPRGRK